ncbi:MAG: hypothetical protein NVSMB9_13750 [Isosphaeraceae bacterium]
MALNPLREALLQAGLNAHQQASAFKPVADSALGQFQAVRDNLERQIRHGDITVKVAREQARGAVAQLKDSLKQQADGFASIPRVFVDRVIEASNTRKRSREHMSVEGLHRETNRLLRANLIEQQLQNRAGEFEGKTFNRTLPGGQPAPNLDSVLSFHEMAMQGGDDAAAEWARRQLESMRSRVADPGDLRRIDLACDRPEAVNPRLVGSYLEALQGQDAQEIEAFVGHAIESGDANACVASFLLAREAPGGTAVRWVRDLLNNLGVFPDSALATLRTFEAEARGSETEAARAQANFAIAIAEDQARFSSVDVPTDDQLSRFERIRAKPVARLGEPIGLALERRGFHGDELISPVETDNAI